MLVKSSHQLLVSLLCESFFVLAQFPTVPDFPGTTLFGQLERVNEGSAAHSPNGYHNYKQINCR